MSNKKTIEINIVNGNAETTFAAVGLNDSKEGIQEFAHKLQDITENIVKGMTSVMSQGDVEPGPDSFKRTDVMKEVQEKLSYEELLIITCGHLEDQAENYLKHQMMQKMMAEAGMGEAPTLEDAKVIEPVGSDETADRE